MYEYLSKEDYEFQRLTYIFLATARISNLSPRIETEGNKETLAIENNRAISQPIFYLIGIC